MNCYQFCWLCLCWLCPVIEAELINVDQAYAFISATGIMESNRS